MKILIGVVAAMLALTLGVANAVLAADAPGGTPAAAKAEQTLEQWCKAHGGTWTSDGHQGGSCTL